MNQEMNNENMNNNVAQPVQPAYTQPVQPQTVATPVQPTYAQAAQPQATVTPVQPAYVQPNVAVETKDSIDKVSNLNKEDAMEEALSHTNQFTPFEVQQEEVNQETNFMSNKKALVFLGIILGIMLLFIIFLPQISKLMGW